MEYEWTADILDLSEVVPGFETCSEIRKPYQAHRTADGCFHAVVCGAPAAGLVCKGMVMGRLHYEPRCAEHADDRDLEPLPCVRRIVVKCLTKQGLKEDVFCARTVDDVVESILSDRLRGVLTPAAALRLGVELGRLELQLRG